MKTFYEWLSDSNLLNELSPDLLHRAADVANVRSIEMGGNPLHKERRDKFRDAAYDRYKFRINVIGNGKPETYDVLKLISVSNKSNVFIVRTSKGATGDFVLDLNKGTFMRGGVTPYVLDGVSARALMNRIKDEFGVNSTMNNYPRMSREQEAMGVGAAGNTANPPVSSTSSIDRRPDFGLVS